MSSTEMDLSPIGFDRKQNITSWLEGDITRLTTRDQNRYQKRKLAITEYFSTEHSIEEISSRHRLASSESLETLAKRCLMLHKDGQPWGFRALIPGIKVVDYTASAESDLAGVKGTPHKETADEGSEVQISIESEGEAQELGLGEVTAKHKAIKSIKAAELPQTPFPGVDKSEKVDTEEGAQISPGAGNDLLSDQAHVEESPAKTSEEDQVATEKSEIAEVEMSEEVSIVQQEFPVVESAIEEGTEPTTKLENSAGELSEPEEAEVVQQEFPTIVEDTGEENAEPTTKLENSAGELSEPEEAEVVQQEFPVAGSVIEAPEEAEVVQQEFPIIVEDTSEEEEAEVVQQEFPTIVENAGEENAEPTAKLEDKASEIFEPEEAIVVEQGLATTGEPASEEGKPLAEESAQTPEIIAEVSTISVVEEAEGISERDEAIDMNDMDTAEVPKAEVDKRRARVAAADTVIVPAAMLEALERADRALLAQTETVETSAISPEALSASTKTNDLATPVEQIKSISIARQEQAVIRPTDMDVVEVDAIPTRELEVRRRNSQQLSATPPWKLPTQALNGESRYQITGSQAALRHSVRRRWEKQEKRKKYQRWVRIISAAVIVSTLVILSIPLCVGLVGYNTYNNIKSVANDGVSNLLALKDLIPANKNDITSALNASKLAQAQTELSKAQDDFLQLQGMVNRPDIESLLQQFAPQYSDKLGMAQRLVQVALDVSRMGQELIGVAQIGANILHGGSLLSSSANTPLLTANDVSSVEAALVHAQYYIQDISTQMSQVNLAELPFGTVSQKAELAKYLQLIPQAQSTISQVQTLVGPVSWLLGVGQTRRFLVQTLDRGELRSSGGFEGQYGVLTLQNGRMAPFTLKDITLLDYAENGAEFGATPPPQYNWMNFGNFGVRDANLSADFPTTAQIVMRYFQLEGGGPVDGVIQITPVIIEQFLQLTGSVYISEYHTTLRRRTLRRRYTRSSKILA